MGFFGWLFGQDDQTVPLNANGQPRVGLLHPGDGGIPETEIAEREINRIEDIRTRDADEGIDLRTWVQNRSDRAVLTVYYMVREMCRLYPGFDGATTSQDRPDSPWHDPAMFVVAEELERRIRVKEFDIDTAYRTKNPFPDYESNQAFFRETLDDATINEVFGWCLAFDQNIVIPEIHSGDDKNETFTTSWEGHPIFHPLFRELHRRHTSDDHDVDLRAFEHLKEFKPAITDRLTAQDVMRGEASEAEIMEKVLQ